MATNPMTLAQFGQTIKAKHPEYADMADEDVGGKVLAKYPQYKDMVQQSPAPAPQPGVLDPRGGWSAGDVLRGAVSGVKNIAMHPIDTVVGMAQPLMASGMAPSGYPSTAATGRPEDSQANFAVQQAAQQDQAQAGQFIKQNPAYAVGSVVGPAVVTAGATKLIPKLAGVAVNTGGRALLLGKTPEGAYESALKPSTTLSQTERANIVKTGLENEVPVSKAGVEKIGDLINNLNQEIKNTIAADPTRPIDPNAVATRADIARARFANQVNAQPDLNAIEASRQQFLTEQGQRPGTPAIPPQPTGLLDAQGRPIMTAGTPATPPQPAPPMNAADAQSMKQGTYQVLKGKYGEQGSAATEAQKSLARGLKEEIATQFPEISKLNASESRLLDLQPVLERAVNRISNHQAIGIGTPIAGTAIQATTGSTSAGAVAMALKAVLDNPMVKSRLAIAVSKTNKIPFSQASARVQAYSTALAATAGASQAYSSNADTPNQ